MARKIEVSHVLDQMVVDYLKAKYPGIETDAVGYQLVRKATGELTLTVNLVVGPLTGEQKAAFCVTQDSGYRSADLIVRES